MKIKEPLIVFCAGACLCGCALFSPPEADSRPVTVDGVRLNRIPGTRAIDIPSGLGNAEVLDAVERAIAGTRPGTRTVAIISQWRPELRDTENRWIRVGLTVRQHYLQVCYRIEDGKLIPDVPMSVNLKQDGTRIHRKVPSWINNLSVLISQQLYQSRSDVNGTLKEQECAQ